MNGDDNGQPNRNFGGGDTHHHKTKNLPVREVHVVIKCDQRNIYGVQHDFNGHKYNDNVSAYQDAYDSNHEQGRAQHQVV